MARPTTPKLPVSKTLISEVLQRVSNAKTKAKKVEILHEYRSDALTKILLCNFAKIPRPIVDNIIMTFNKYRVNTSIDIQYFIDNNIQDLIEEFS